MEAYTVGSAEFALCYAATNRDKCIPMMDNGHYHPTELVSDKILALLTPNAKLKRLQDKSSFTKLLVRQEELMTMPFGEIWNEYCRLCNVPEDGAWFPEVHCYEQEVLAKR